MPKGYTQENAHACLDLAKLKENPLTSGLMTASLSPGSPVHYRALSVLVADDMGAFRDLVAGMLGVLGVEDIDLVSSGAAALDACARKSYQVVLCDYDLGAGLNGQQVLEALRHRCQLKRDALFMMVSAESSRNIVLSTYEYEPDEYLMKPLNVAILRRRLNRLLARRSALLPVYRVMDKGDIDAARDILTERSIAEDRHAIHAQRLLGDLFVEEGDWPKAEKVFRRAMDLKNPDWARLGFARARIRRGEAQAARDSLRTLVNERPLYLPAYDGLAEAYAALGDEERQAETFRQALTVSPLSIDRQRCFAELLSTQADTHEAWDAWKSVVALGEDSCRGCSEDVFRLVDATEKVAEQGAVIDDSQLSDLDLQLSALESSDRSSHRRVCLARSRIASILGEQRKALKFFEKSGGTNKPSGETLSCDIDHYRALLNLSKHQDAEWWLRAMVDAYRHDQHALARLDYFLPEPMNDDNREHIAKVNREGIEYYTAGEFDRALQYFERARLAFPKHLGIQLNIAQALLGKLKEHPELDDVREQCQGILRDVESRIGPQHIQHERLLRLKRRLLRSIQCGGAIDAKTY